jgi:hypothetical protein
LDRLFSSIFSANALSVSLMNRFRAQMLAAACEEGSKPWLKLVSRIGLVREIVGTPLPRCRNSCSSNGQAPPQIQGEQSVGLHSASQE